jgi:kynurenine formamidase/D-alanyl-D-alanine dipeptidase
MNTMRALTILTLIVSAPARAEGPPIEAGPFRPGELVELVGLDPSIHLDIRYATRDNLVGRPLYDEARAFLQRPAAEALVRVNHALRAKGYALLIFDGYRPWSVTRQLWDATPAAKKVFVANPAEGSKHNRGCAVDLSLVDLATGKEVVMPSGYDETTSRAYATYDGAPKAARERRDLLRRAMEKEGFFVYPFEWWHFDYKDWKDYAIGTRSFKELDADRATRPAPFPERLDLVTARVVDLTWAFDEKTLYWPTSPSGFERKSLSFGKTAGGFFYAANTISAPEHGGTHLDAPLHFREGGLTADQIPVRQLVAPAVVLDVAAAASKDRDYRLTADDVKRWEAQHGLIPRGAILLLRTGWSSRYGDRKRYFGDDTRNDASHLHFPSYGKEAALLLVKERAVGGLGVDTASIDHGPSQDFPVHQLVAAAGLPAFENLANLGELPATGAWVVALPMKIAGGSGGPLRIVALLAH